MTEHTWLGDEHLQFNIQANVVDTYLVRVPSVRKQNGAIVWRYYGVPAAVIVVLKSVLDEIKKPAE